MKSKVTDIIINFPTNLGDTILALPTLDRIKSNYPNSNITAIASKRTQSLLDSNTFIDKVIVFDKTWGIKEKGNFTYSLRSRYQLMVDLKHTLLPMLLKIKYRTPYIRKFSKTEHITDKYLRLIQKLAPKPACEKSQFNIPKDKRSNWDNLDIENAIFFACASLSVIKRYPYENLKIVVENTVKTNPVVILGTEEEKEAYKDILTMSGIIDLTGQTTLMDIYYLFKKYAKTVVAVDSSLMHLASYADIPVVALFGPTPPQRSLPKSKGSIILQNKKAKCAPCDVAECSQRNECMDIPSKDVIDAIKQTLSKDG